MADFKGAEDYLRGVDGDLNSALKQLKEARADFEGRFAERAKAREVPQELRLLGYLIRQVDLNIKFLNEQFLRPR